MSSLHKKTFQEKFGWMWRFPYIFLLTLYLKIKNRRRGTNENYAEHQKEFFGFAVMHDSSDKFHKFRAQMARDAANHGTTKRALDIATGYGFQAVALKEIGISEVSAIDLVPERVEHCRRLWPNMDIDFKVMNAADLKFPPDYFDAVTVSAALHDMPNQTRQAALKEISRVTKDVFIFFEPKTLKPGIKAWLYATLGSILDESLNFKGYVYCDIDQELKMAGFEIIKKLSVWHNIMSICVCRKRKTS